MQKINERLILSPSDLTRFLDSTFVTWMDRFHLEFPGVVEPDAEDETNKILQQKGIHHERVFLQKLLSENRDVYDVSSEPDKFTATIEAMKEGREVIYQGALRDGQFLGYADFLVKTAGDSQLGNYHYEPWDTKLALKSKPYFLVQLACYADLLCLIQNVLPKNIYVVLGNQQLQAFRTEDYIYYYRQLRQALIKQQENWDKSKPPDFTGMENFGRWTTHAQNLMEEKDHLCRVANIRSGQIKKLTRSGITTMAQLAYSELDTIAYMQPETFFALKQQARLQVESKGLVKPKYEVILSQGRGLFALPAPSPLDVYFDMEGYPLASGGLEYLFGATVKEGAELKFYDWWAHNNEQEKLAFEAFIDWVYARWLRDPSMHIYHYAAYERTALRRLMGKYGTREKELDDLLRHEVFVDLFTVVRQSLRVGEPGYSIKNIEHLYKEKREGPVSTAMGSVVFYQRWLDDKDGDDWQSSKILAEIRAYNKEDCDSTYMLACWLWDLQQQQGISCCRKEDTPPANPESQQRREVISQMVANMLQGIPADLAEKNEEMRLRELLAYLVEFHWREAKPVFWAKYDRHEMTEQELFEDPACLAGLTREKTIPRAVARSFHYDYSFQPVQDTKIDAGDECFFAHDLSKKIKIAQIDPDKGKVVLKCSPKMPPPPDYLSLIKNEYVDASIIAASIFRTASAFMDGQPLPQALEDFLTRRKPRIKGWVSGPIIPAGKDLTAGVMDAVSCLDNGTLCIQGPPGSGKTYTAARAIVALLNQGLKIGITSNSHKAIAHLMDKVAQLQPDKGLLRAVKVQSDSKDFYVQDDYIHACPPKKLFESKQDFNLIGGTAWLFSNPETVGMLDYLFVDEAGQVSIANLVGMAPSARNLVLIGDQMQLSQPLQGTHPGESGQSVLQYLLQNKQVVPDDFGIFLGSSWRMHPDICNFISGAVYEDRLYAQDCAARRFIHLPDEAVSEAQGSWSLKSSGIVYVPVQHEGNSQDSEEEARAIVRIVEMLRTCSFVDGTIRRMLVPNDILIVAPYNMQVRRLQAALPGIKVGSVDKFQGQEAPVVIVSMCSSSADTSSRGLEFIFNKNRLNVAISRAQSLAIIVGSPELASVHCNYVEQMELVNLFCRIIQTGTASLPVLPVVQAGYN